MGEGWETARRRDDGNDWVEVRLAAPGVVRLAELDTSHFKGNAPGWASCPGPRRGATGDGVRPAARTRLQPDTRHRFLVERRLRRPMSGSTSTRTAAWPGCGCSAA